MVIVTAHSGWNASENPKVLSATCPAGTRLTGGGGKIIHGPGTVGQVRMTASAPQEDAVGVSSTRTWVVRADTLQSFVGNWQIQPFAVCARIR